MRATGWLRALTTGTRVLVGALLAVLVVALVIAAVGASVPGVSREALRIVDRPTPSQTVAVCPGPLLASGRTVGAAGDVTIAGGASVVSGSPDGTPREDVLTAPVGEGPRVLRLDPTGDMPAAVAAAQSASVADEDLLGFAAAACTAPQFDSWLVGGATRTGSADLVVLSNPGDVPATVQLTVYASGGALTPPGGRDIVIGAGSQAVVPLAGLVLGELESDADASAGRTGCHRAYLRARRTPGHRRSGHVDTRRGGREERRDRFGACARANPGRHRDGPCLRRGRGAARQHAGRCSLERGGTARARPARTDGRHLHGRGRSFSSRRRGGLELDCRGRCA